MTTKIMTNIDTYFYKFIDLESKENKVSKREILETIIASYIENRKKDEIQKSYALMGKDTEYLSEMQMNTNYLGNL